VKFEFIDAQKAHFPIELLMVSTKRVFLDRSPGVP